MGSSPPSAARLGIICLVVAVLLPACRGAETGAPPGVGAAPPEVVAADPIADPTTVVPTTVSPPTTAAAKGAPPTSGAPATAASQPAPAPATGFAFDAQPLPPAVRQRMTGPVWRPGCPVGLDDLRTIRLTFWGFDGAVHEGTLVAHHDAVSTLRAVFAELHAARFPIRQIRPIEEFGGDDNASMDADNTSAFNCRPSTGTSSSWSQHAYGRAIDINPRENPYVTSTGVEPEAGKGFLDRTTSQPGLIGASSVVVRAFERRGWGWGGRWSSSKDYQHFSATGR